MINDIREIVLDDNSTNIINKVSTYIHNFNSIQIPPPPSPKTYMFIETIINLVHINKQVLKDKRIFCKIYIRKLYFFTFVLKPRNNFYKKIFSHMLIKISIKYFI